MDVGRIGAEPWRRPWRPTVDVGFVVAVLLAWQALRIPVEGRSAESIANARAWLRLERALGLDVEDALVSLVQRQHVAGAADWLYSNVHVPVLLGFMVAVRLAAPTRYPLVRTTYALSFVPALAVIALYPLAPPRWLPEHGGEAQTDAELTGGVAALLDNETAAAASQHFSLALLVGAVTVWLWPRARLTPVAAAYPAVVLVVIVGTSQHYLLDCAVGAATLGPGLLVARRLHADVPPAAQRVPAKAAVARAAAGVALVAWAVESLVTAPAASWPWALAAVAGATVTLLWTPARAAAVLRSARSTSWALLSTTGLATLLAYLLVRQALAPGFTDYWGYIVLQVAATLVLLLGLGVAFAREGGLSWYTHLVVTANTWADTLGTAGHLYERHASYDKVTHFFAGVAIVAAVADVLRALDERGLLRWTLQRRLAVAVAATLVLNLGWEAYEYLGDILFDTGRHKGALDTTYDLVADLAGALVSVAVLAGTARGAYAGARSPSLRR
jgi:uncharacterized membrane protein YjdF